MENRALIALFGVLPATVLAPYAAFVGFLGAHLLVSQPADADALILVFAGLSGLLGVSGLWLVLLRGPSRVAGALILAGILAVVGIVAGVLLTRSSDAPLRLFTASGIDIVLFGSPLIVGILQIVRCYRCTSKQTSA